MKAQLHQLPLAALAPLLITLAAGCAAGDSTSGPATTVVSAAPGPTSEVTSVPLTTVPATPVATSAPTTLPAPTYTLPSPPPSLPQPIPAPLDDTASEPVVPLGSISIPAIEIDRPLFEGIRLPTFDVGPGHWPGTAMPGGNGNMVIGGHRTEGNADFADIDRLRPGDEVVVTDTAGASYTYIVGSVEIADPFATRLVYQTPEPTGTLFACHPPGSVAQRIVVHLALDA